MLRRITRAFRVRPGEGRLVLLQSALMLAVFGGSTAGLTAAEALFFSRFGVQYLPYAFVALGVTTFLVSMGNTALLGRIPRETFYLGGPLVLCTALLLERAVLAVAGPWFYPVLWVLTSAQMTVQFQISWGIAGAILDGRQAKRLFPLFTAGSILGAAIGGLAARGLVAITPVENLFLLWAAGHAAAFVLARALVGAKRRVAPAARKRSVLGDMLEGFRFVREAALLRWLSLTVGLFTLLMFTLSFPFSQSAAEAFGDASSLAAFLATFQSVATGAALLLSLFVANRLFALFGITLMVLALPAIFAVGFATAAILPAFAVLVAFRFSAMAWMQGVAMTAWMAIFSVVPADRRDRVRMFNAGIPGQIGTIAAGLILIAGAGVLRPRDFFIVGLVASLACCYSVWRVHRSYGRALVDVLRAGWPHVFYEEEEPFGGVQQDAAALATVVKGLQDANPATRRVAAEILGSMRAAGAVPALVQAARDDDGEVREAVMRALGRLGEADARDTLVAGLADADPDVRVAAVESIARHATSAPGAEDSLRLLLGPLLADPDPAPRAAAAGALLNAGGSAEARQTLATMAIDGDPQTRRRALLSLAMANDPDSYEVVAPALLDPIPAVRRAAVHALVRTDPARALEQLVPLLGDDDHGVRSEAARALGALGERALPRVVAALGDVGLEGGALLALKHLDPRPATAQLRAYAHAEAEAALRYYRLAASFAGDQDERVALLYRALVAAAVRDGRHALEAVGFLGDADAVTLAVQALDSPDPKVRGSALEALDAIEPRVVRPVLRVWDPIEPTTVLGEAEMLAVLGDDDAWIRTCAALAAGGWQPEAVRAALARLATGDRDETVREAATRSIGGGETLETLRTLSLVERVLFLGRVPLFAELPPVDLKHIAAAASERQVADGATIVRQGEHGEEMYVIISGQVRVLLENGDSTPVEIARRGPGEYVGEMAIISQEPRSATMVAIGDVRLLTIHQLQFRDILRERPETCLVVMRELCRRLRQSESNLERRAVAAVAS